MVSAREGENLGRRKRVYVPWHLPQLSRNCKPATPGCSVHPCHPGNDFIVILIDMLFSMLVLIAAGLWVGQLIRRGWERRQLKRGYDPRQDEFWQEYDNSPPRRRSVESYASRHRSLYTDDDWPEDESGWHVKNVSHPQRCEICHQSDQFDPETLVCGRCGHYTH